MPPRQILAAIIGKPLSMGLRERVIAAIDVGLSHRAAAARYGIALSTAIQWDIERRTTGSFAPKPQGGDMRSRSLEGVALGRGQDPTLSYIFGANTR
jgi:hypothetical protein